MKKQKSTTPLLNEAAIETCATSARSLGDSLHVLAHLIVLRRKVAAGASSGAGLTRLQHMDSGMGFDMPRELLVEMLDRSISKRVLQLSEQGVHLTGDIDPGGKSGAVVAFTDAEKEASRIYWTKPKPDSAAPAARKRRPARRSTLSL